MIKTIAIAAALTAPFFAAEAASTYITNGGPGGVQATIADSGDYDSTAAIGLRYMGREYINIDIPSAWYRFSVNGTDLTAQYGSNPLGAVTFGAGPAATTSIAFGDWSFSQTAFAATSNKITYHLNVTNNTGKAVHGQWEVGFDPDQDGSGHNATLNTILGQHQASAVSAFGPLSRAKVTLMNDTSASATDVAAFINVGDCCSAVSANTAFGAFQLPGFSHLGDDSISLAYDFGVINAGQTVSVGYSVVFAPIPEPETYALMLGGMGMVGFVARRRAAKRA